MDYNIIERSNKVIVKDMNDFNPKHIFECGQAFRWQIEEDRSYTIVHNGKILNVKKEGEDVVFSNTNILDFYDIWYDYFDLGRDYSRIKDELSKDPVLKEAIKFGEGIRILNQDPFETTISFIISANNQIPRIKRSIELISQNYGKFIGLYNGKKYFSFPSPNILAEAKEEELEKNCRVGYRAKYIINTSNMINNKKVDLDKLFKISTEEAKETLMQLPGVGPKVSSCILLFSLNKSDAFPVDVWVKRVMEHFYLKENIMNEKIAMYAKEKFGSLAGFAQQYLFYYARELGIGRKSNKGNMSI
ncbi:N-glycosylase/DNA lyase [Keratinibaculum paraultunense]|uniref:DNA-(apurinic or apyrimidinic site) lyase n=1 Tax=Keratinibaculum paraultunense TaxID=1278232 RepID=A0A4R3L057_9FIRM|nr:DNA glycosylase [Keratinibaculum paraultunense]QQY80134.1 8-oxoguanine DNA glycosylase [Keratinibaculum paraultunense]TCS91545.1 N-glycosylase/DNA lyase [Keratinibaculum paraultunense]